MCWLLVERATSDDHWPEEVDKRLLAPRGGRALSKC